MRISACFNRLVGGTGERANRYDMENYRHLVNRSDCLQSRQVFAGMQARIQGGIRGFSPPPSAVF